MELGGQLVQFLFVDFLCRTVVCGQPDVVAARCRTEVWYVAAVEFCQGFGCGAVFAYLVEQGHEAVVLLPIHLLQLYGEVSGQSESLA